MLSSEFFERFARHTTQNELIAVEHEGLSVTYPELLGWVTEIESRLPEGIHVVLKMPKSIGYIALMLACIKKGIGFTSLDPCIPEERLTYIVSDLGENARVIQEMSDLECPEGLAIPGNLAYIAYTSGSTGNPKGVKIAYAGLANTIDQQIKMFGANGDTRFLWLLSQGFDASLSDIFVTLLSGGTLAIPDKSLSDLVRGGRIEALFNQKNITHSDIPPSLLKRLRPEKFTSLKTIVVGGEVAEKSVILDFVRNGFDVFNVYGPTEASICSSMNRCGPDFRSASIGYPLDNIRYSILDTDTGEFIEEEGRSGELVITGVGLAIGYTQSLWNQRRFTRRKNTSFYRTGDRVYRSQDEYFFVGRIDRQFKHNGQLICPEEIETTLNSHPQVSNASVHYSGKRIIASIEAETDIAETDLKVFLADYLPAYMIPSAYEFSGALSLNANAKVDHREIESNSLLTMVTECFKNHLGHDSVSPEASFSDLGGDSLTLMDVILDLEDKGLQVNIDQLAANDSARGISESLTYSQNKSITNLSEEIQSLPPVPEVNLVFHPEEEGRAGILLTGATGFLGIHLLKDLSDQNITVLVRGQDKEEALQRLSSKADKEGLSIDLSKVRVVLGDVSEPLLGLSAGEYEELSKSIGTIVHSAAVVNNLKSLRQIYDSNVMPLKTMADFSVTGRRKVFHNISSLSVLVSKQSIPAVLPENSELRAEDSDLYSGYAQSKWLGEYYLSQYTDCLDLVNHRPGLLLPKKDQVTIKKSSFLSQLVTEIEKIKELPIGSENFSFDITPVDLASSVISKHIMVGCQTGNYHITTDEKISLKDIGRALDVNWIPAETWIDKYKSKTVWLYFYELHGAFPQFNLFETTRVSSFAPRVDITLTDKDLYLKSYLSNILGRNIK